MNKSTYEQELEQRGRLIYVTSGRSMRPFLRSGEDLVELTAKGPQQRFSKFDVILYRRPSGTYVLHRIVKVLPDSYVLCGDNCHQREPGITDDQILALLTGIIRKGKKLDIHTPRYRFRVALWCALFLPRSLVIRIRILAQGVWKRLISLGKRSN